MRSHRRTRHIGSLAAVAALVALLIPYASSDEGEAAATTPSSSIVYDPGPKLRCYSVSNESGGTNYGNDSRDCDAVDNRNRVDGSCTWFGYASRRGVECPTWRFVTYGWEENRLRQYPGYDHQVQGPSGSPLKLVLQNNSRNLRDQCELKEVAFSYEYVGSSLKRRADGKEYNFSDGRAEVSYDALVEQSGDFRCAERRAVLTTDFIYRTARGLNLISVVHHDPGPFSRPNRDGVLWTNNCKNGEGAPSGCRVTVYGQRIEPGRTTRINVDFTEVARRYAAYLRNDPIPEVSQIEAVQVVNSARGADLKAEVSEVNVTLK
ncbi:hypothetical protein ADL00_41605 [Streptomyces sp. AS58]|uniref:Uncharacterized protein n=1 Tax=Streptomyces cadmiisoli TaxID=2184053 RepID=A0A2Z4JDU9_9ACTN|nr:MULTISPECIES: hypothetical protein [Streptomyces]AWW43221.1 hypothetical protein DN051_42245 [Streptomyces cadmiisoli]KOV51049.1 hypothetical protein ADL00_41605 [Streptomyces sp. AS58]